MEYDRTPNFGPGVHIDDKGIITGNVMAPDQSIIAVKMICDHGAWDKDEFRSFIETGIIEAAKRFYLTTAKKSITM